MNTDALPLRAVWLDHANGVRAGAISGSTLTPSRYVEPQEWNLLRHTSSLPFSVHLTAAQRTIAQHAPVPVMTEGRPDPHARWRDLIRASGEAEPTTYRRGRCRVCQPDGSCVLLNAAKVFAEVIGQYLRAEGEA